MSRARHTATVLRYAALCGLQDFGGTYTIWSWGFGLFLRMMTQVAFFASIGLLLGSASCWAGPAPGSCSAASGSRWWSAPAGWCCRCSPSTGWTRPAGATGRSCSQADEARPASQAASASPRGVDGGPEVIGHSSSAMDRQLAVAWRRARIE